MKMFIFPEIEQLTKYYHSGGALVVIAESKRHVKRYVKEFNSKAKDGDVIEITDAEWKQASVYNLAPPSPKDPNSIYFPQIFRFPDAGCC
jgi:hypothetical protein